MMSELRRPNLPIALETPGQTSGIGAAPAPAMWSFEQEVWRSGFRLIAGVDEAGRGPIAGPVVAAAVVLPVGFDAVGIADSKTLSGAQREQAYERIRSGAHAVGLGIVDRVTIDRINILQATHLAMLIALQDLCPGPDFCLVDGLPVPRLPVPHRAIVKGDSLSVSIAAASIVAKVTRDRLMCEMDGRYPGYGFARHKGYGTADHLRSISELGLSPEHRRSFRPCSEMEKAPCLLLEDAGG